MKLLKKGHKGLGAHLRIVASGPLSCTNRTLVDSVMENANTYPLRKSVKVGTTDVLL